MTKPYPALCKDCKWSVPDGDRSWTLLCTNPIINANDPWALTKSEDQIFGSSTRDERSRNHIFAKCGTKGKLWEAK